MTSSSFTTVSNDEMALMLVVSGVVALFTIPIQASFFHGFPLQQLGQRPNKGHGLFGPSYFGSMRRGIGVWGYDPIQGALSPMLRFLVHASTILIIWGSSIYIYTATLASLIKFDIKNCEYSVVIGGIVLIVYLYCSSRCFGILPGVSVPSGPRLQKIQRTPQWRDQYWMIHSHSTNNNKANGKEQTTSPQLHRYVHGQESHLISEQLYNVDYEGHNSITDGNASGGSSRRFRLTGESAGRDIWTTTSIRNDTQNVKDTTSNNSCVSNDLLQSFASGGRPYMGFNPNINPNRYVLPLSSFHLLRFLVLLAATTILCLLFFSFYNVFNANKYNFYFYSPIINI